ncbi:hypothetical protein LguiB_003646 [Lonicera macranthoides]
MSEVNDIIEKPPIAGLAPANPPPTALECKGKLRYLRVPDRRLARTGTRRWRDVAEGSKSTSSLTLSLEKLADQIFALLDCRDNNYHNIPLHLAMHIKDAFTIGVKISLQNATRWNKLQGWCATVAQRLLGSAHRLRWIEDSATN